MSYDVLDSRDLLRRRDELRDTIRTVYVVVWDNGDGASGTFPEEFETETAAQEYGERWAHDSNVRDFGKADVEDGYSFEVEEKEVPDLDDEQREELEALDALFANDLPAYDGDYNGGVTLIEKAGFEDYARQYAEDTGAIKDGVGWPYDHIDWEAAADAMAMDYAEIEFRGVDYLFRE